MAKRVLVVDDDENTRRFLSVALQENGYEPITAEDGRDGLEKIEKEKPDLVILDVMMPKKTGFVLFKQLRRDEKYKDLPVIMLTGVSEVLAGLDEKSEDTHERPYDSLREALRKTIQQMREEGLVKPDMFVDKPIDPEQVISKVRKLIGD
ncbi:MAG: response regulator [candidate division Zixibacteria bacterium]|jgi:DNA-binding response OmpR family regulator|nr:response regulator [candidate division Zixibacteria bacterium]NIR67853.1 response regulator [candidate division Zixibacteria bacterium]NIS15549.1 response regulator [candidate division Zixibacteria bacterium]NIS49079.1 response regulator [candidate division Zixibacteria bacterium]NIT52074.1 response regulator [candidate division Zixibacteria bacterium]